MIRAIITAIGLAAASIGCAGDLMLDGAEVDVALEVEVERAEWLDAEPGCEDVDASRMTLAACEGEPLLAALVDETGHVACVDSRSVLLVQTGALDAVHPVGADPSPQPSHPGMSDMDGADDSGAVGSKTLSLQLRPSTGGTRDDPTPTPIVAPVRTDPTPTPVVQPEERDDPTPTPILLD